MSGTQSQSLAPTPALIGHIDGPRFRDQINSLPSELIRMVVEAAVTNAFDIDSQNPKPREMSSYVDARGTLTTCPLLTSVEDLFEKAAGVAPSLSLMGPKVRAEVFSVLRSELQAWSTMTVATGTGHKQCMRDLATTKFRSRHRKQMDDYLGLRNGKRYSLMLDVLLRDWSILVKCSATKAQRHMAYLGLAEWVLRKDFWRYIMGKLNYPSREGEVLKYFMDMPCEEDFSKLAPDFSDVMNDMIKAARSRHSV